MKKFIAIISILTICFAFNNCIAQTQSYNQKSVFMVRHSVIFKLKTSLDSAEVLNFFNAAKKLANIPGVQNFEALKQTSKKNKFEYGLSMEFATEELYSQYTNHPDHVNFVQQYWLKNVEDFLEIDYSSLK